MKFTHRSQGPRKGTGNAFVPGAVGVSKRRRRDKLSEAQIAVAASVAWRSGARLGDVPDWFGVLSGAGSPLADGAGQTGQSIETHGWSTETTDKE